jgi:hypothetical protein
MYTACVKKRRESIVGEASKLKATTATTNTSPRMRVRRRGIAGMTSRQSWQVVE